MTAGVMSLSARRAWIEITVQALYDGWRYVALRKESVDRNKITGNRPRGSPTSLSARRAWIEMGFGSAVLILILSLSARRAWIEMSGHRQAHTSPASRSPQGERG